jgi:hypothetical protein
MAQKCPRCGLDLDEITFGNGISEPQKHRPLDCIYKLRTLLERIEPEYCTMDTEQIRAQQVKKAPNPAKQARIRGAWKPGG